MANLSILLGFLVLIFFNVILPSYSATHSVDWSLGVDYSSFSTGKTFAVGDTIVFNYGASHTVDEVSESDYKSCSLGNGLSSDSSGKTSIALKTSGTHYFICGTPGHCSSGMKLSVTVAAASSGATATPNPSTASGGGGSSNDVTPKTTKASSSNSSGAGTVSKPYVVALVGIWAVALYALTLT